MRTAITLAVLLAAVPTYALDEWTKANTRVQVAFTVAGLADIALTDRVLRTTDSREQNPLLGSHPTRARLWGLGLSGLLLHALVARVLPDSTRGLWQTMGLSAEIAVGLGNATIMVGGRF